MNALILSIVTLLPVNTSPYEYRYFHEAVPLEVDVTRIAVLAPEGLGAGEVGALSEAGLQPQDLTPHPITGWYWASLPSALRTAQGVEETVARMAADQRLRFVTPVFHTGDPDLPQFPTADIIVSFNEGVNGADALAILQSAVPGKVEPAGWEVLPNTYVIHSDLASGTAVLEAANALAVRDDVQFAVPDRVITGRQELIP